MPAETIFLTTYVTLMGGGLGALFWSRLNRIEAQLDALSVSAATQDDVRELRNEISQMRQEQATMRSDLTHVALAVGARSPGGAES